MSLLGIFGAILVLFVMWKQLFAAFRKVRTSEAPANPLPKAGGSPFGPTVEVPLEAAHAVVLAQAIRPTIMGFAVMAAIALPLPVLVAYFAVGYIPWLLLIIGGASALGALVLGGFGWQAIANLRLDAARSTILRTSGPIAASQIRSMSFLDLADRSILVSPAIADRIPAGCVGVIDYTHHAHVVFIIRGEDGREVYRDPRFSPALERQRVAATA